MYKNIAKIFSDHLLKFCALGNTCLSLYSSGSASDPYLQFMDSFIYSCIMYLYYADIYSVNIYLFTYLSINSLCDLELHMFKIVPCVSSF